MRVWIAAALLALGLFDLEFSNLTARAEQRASTSPVTQEQALMDGPDGFPPR